MDWVERAARRYQTRCPDVDRLDAVELANELWRDRQNRDEPEDAVDDEIQNSGQLYDSSLD
ncbi:hypothetical protein AAW51_4842 [Caldimonas brevitalea]|uniref:Uncharacterized protein n=1 Tax=Caldimonas brevitalea TaxID=413882 RepID=A0A0G3BU31_9BURK|nr:hypothetical protein AAW51_4842 [Caldimonas brevitalea]